MCKRFIDVGLWKQPWYLDLTAEQKVVWHYLTLQCDTGGLWKVEPYQLKRDTGITNLNFDEAIAAINRDYDNDKPITVNRIMYLPGKRKIWITGFFSFQYEKGKNGVNAAIPAIKGAINKLRDEGILEYAIKNGFVRLFNYKEENGKGCQGLPRVKDKDKDMDKEQDKDCCSFFKQDGGVGEDELPSFHSSDPATPLDKTDEEPVQTNDFKGAIEIPEDAVFLPLTERYIPPAIGGRGDALPTFEKPSKFVTESLFLEHWLTLPHPAELKLADDIYNEYGKANFEFALKQALEYKIKKIPYIRAICKKRREKESIEKEKEEARRKKLEIEQQIEENRKNGVKLNLVEIAFGKDNQQPNDPG